MKKDFRKTATTWFLSFVYKYALPIIGVIMFACFALLLYNIWEILANYASTPEGERNMILITKYVVVLYGGRKVTVYVVRKAKKVQTKLAGL